jgi:hypothetical protein
MRNLPRLFLGVVLAGLACTAARANVVLEWDALMLDAIRAGNTGPTLGSRNLAILNLAIYDAVAAITRTHQPYRGAVEAPAGAALEAAVAAAGREVMLALYPSFQPRTTGLFARQAESFSAGDATTHGLAVGQAVAQHLLTERVADGSNTQVPYIPSAEPGQWRRTPPYYRPPLDPHWRYVDLFALPEVETFLPPPPPALTSAQYAEDLNEVKLLGRRESTARTAEQSQIAVFWSDFSYTATPPGHWHEIAAAIATERALPVTETARLLALLSLAQADAAIVCWETKYRYNLWRPVTAIWRADEDGNPDTAADPAWMHFLSAPPFPEYTSGHSTFSKTSAQVLTHFFGTDALTFTARSDSLPGVTRTFHSLAACADEIGMSRIYGGIHFQFANREGKRSGARIADFVSANYFLENTALPRLSLEMLGPAGARVRIHGHIGRTCVLEASSDLRHWTAIATNIAVAGGCVVNDPTAAPIRFYRVTEP